MQEQGKYDIVKEKIMDGWKINMIYLVGINVLTFVLYGIDKQRAKNGKWRIRERTLLGLAAIGGSIGALLAMEIFRHKTKKPRFSVGIPCMLVAQMLIFWYLT